VPGSPEGSLKIGIRWTCLSCDLDLYSRPAAGREEIFYGNPRTEEGVYFKDFRTSPAAVNRFEWIEYLEPVDLSEVEAAVNFYGGQSPGGVSGEVWVQSGESLHRGEFEIEASEGNQGDESQSRATSLHWTVLDIGSIVEAEDVQQTVPESKSSDSLSEQPDEPNSGVRGSGRESPPEPIPERRVQIILPKDGSKIRGSRTVSGPTQHPVEGVTYGYDQDDIERLGLVVEVSIFTNQWFPQGLVEVRSDGTWRLPTAYFGGMEHTVRAVLKDQNGIEIHSHEVRVTVIH
jgi:hypothetical protein